ncbi:hypothetical protein H310_09387 [Aphanomyces invadans]|uniref:DDE Tnp4 domain-containing protein n=1 Tax=Aphanomyces invadans TaxID=157072 RepID=A0A024TTX2_9STRA|nr:hypothetical protein H310_09387 [Aphanomyces invadans]ETV97458.1 hypothetical protein H310_09387 [Aphanomyces invadans]|eukprot:XP_008873667.1 hypothetical protein H310_09387 [Aphanomyces invadans]
MEQIHVSGRPFANYPYAKYATDIKFQPSHRPAGRFEEQKHYFSGKHKLYGLKIEASASPHGKLVGMSNHEPGSVSDVTMFRLSMTTVSFIKPFRTCGPYWSTKVTLV